MLPYDADNVVGLVKGEFSLSDLDVLWPNAPVVLEIHSVPYLQIGVGPHELTHGLDTPLLTLKSQLGDGKYLG